MLQEYYSNYFNVDLLINLIGLSTFRRREFGFDLGNGNFVRNISFRTPTQLVAYMAHHGVFQAYVGAVYEEGPSRKKSIQKLKWDYRELGFDIDLDEYDPIRVCGCSGKKFCKTCWEFAKTAIILLDNTMKDDFGFQETRWIFSGRRGVHGWVLDENGKKLNRKQRSSIIQYLSMDGIDANNFNKKLRYVHPLRLRVIDLVAYSYFLHASPSELMNDLGFREKDAKRIIKAAEAGRKKFNWKQDLPSNVDAQKAAQKVFEYRFPRIDGKVTCDIRRLLKIPNSINGLTGNECRVIEDYESFDPIDDVPSIFNYI